MNTHAQPLDQRAGPAEDLSKLLARAEAASKDQDWPTVHSIFQLLRERHPEERAGWVQDGVAHLRHGDPNAAECLLAEATLRFPGDKGVGEFAVKLAEEAARRGDSAEAHRHWAYVREHFPTHLAGWVRGGIAHLQHGDLVLAESLLAEAVRRF
jgi:predicted Zn-dependent protease